MQPTKNVSLKIFSRHFITGEELSQVELGSLLEMAENFRVERELEKTQPPNNLLKNKTLALIFEKPSLRTRLSFTVGIQELGGRVLELLGAQKKNEEPEDAIRVLQGMVHGVMLRTFDHSIFERMQTHATIPIINGLSDLHHPCQTLADLLTLSQKFSRLRGLKVAYIGDGNNILHSLLLLAPYMGVDVHFACPNGYEPHPQIVEQSLERAKKGSAKILRFKTPEEAVKGVNAIYTDVWTSMGFENEKSEREKAFEGYQVNSKLYSLADPEAILLHCLPMNRNVEITSEMAEHKNSAIFQQAENRLHAQKALLFWLYN